MIIKDVIYSDPFREALKNHIIECYRPKEKSLGTVNIEGKMLNDVRDIYYMDNENWLDIFDMLGDN